MVLHIKNHSILRNVILIISMAFWASYSFGQSSEKFFFNEFQISVNRSNVENSSTENRFDFGLGAYHVFRAENKFNFVFGVEYNQVNQYKSYVYNNGSSGLSDLTFNLSGLSVPIGVRYNFGSKTKVFIEGGGFADLFLISKVKGTSYSYSTNEYGDRISLQKPYEDQFGGSYYGAYLGIGVRIPTSKFDITIKPEYKFSINQIEYEQSELYNWYYRLNIGIGLK